jgi:nitroreductase
VIAIVVSGKGPVAFDAGRAAQNMMLAAWNQGVVCCPNAITNPESLTELLGLEPDVQVKIVLSFGYPGRPQDPQARLSEEWISRADRRALEEVARHL